MPEGTATPSDRPSRPFVSRGYSEEVIEQLWELATPVDGNDPEVWRKDEFGAWIARDDYGNRDSEFGWEADEIPGTSPKMGIAHLRAIHWQNYLDPYTTATQSRVTAEGLHNVRRLV